MWTWKGYLILSIVSLIEGLLIWYITQSFLSGIAIVILFFLLIRLLDND